MDPQRTWQRVVDAYAAEDWAALFEHAANLHQWLTKGERVPPLDGRQVLMLACDLAGRLAANKHAEGVDPEGRGVRHQGHSYCLSCLDDHFPHAWDSNPEPQDIRRDDPPIRCCKCGRAV
jgi:hypothetical protein